MIKDYDEYKEALANAECPFRRGSPNYYMVFDSNDKSILVDQDTSMRRQGVTYLGYSYARAKTFVQIWRKSILKYEFGIDTVGGTNNEQRISRGC